MSDKLIRALARGGCVSWRGGAWSVRRGDDLRGGTIGELPQASLASLIDAGDLREQRPGLFMWSGRPPIRSRAVHTPAAKPRKRADRLSPLQSVLSVIPDHQERALAQAAAHRFAGDMERAASGRRITQNWDVSLHVDGVSGIPREGGRMVSAVAASKRLEQVACALTSEQMRDLTRLLVEQRSLSALSRIKGMSTTALRHALSKTLIDLAAAFRLCVSSAR